MCTLTRAAAGAVLCAAALLSSLHAPACAAGSYAEDFTTTAYFDDAHSTALWDTSAGIVSLPPFDLTEVGACATVGNALSVALHGDYAFVCESSVGIDVVDISDVSSPVVVCSFGTPGNAYEAVPAGNWLYVADDGGGLVVLDITSPSAPSYVANCYTPGNARDLAVAGDYAFVADREAGLVVIDISDPTAPTLAGSVATPGLALNVELSGDLAYVSNWESGVQIIDITDPTAPFIAGSYDTPGQAWFLDLDGDFLYVGDGPAGLHILDLYSPLSPVLLSTHDTPGSVNGVTVSGDYVYVCDFASGLRLVDAADKSAPVEVSVLDTPGSCRHLALAGEHAFVADREGGFRVVSARELYGPVVVGRAPTYGHARCVAAQGNCAYVVCNEGYLDVFGIDDPTSPRQIGRARTLGADSLQWSFDAMAIAGDIAYVAHGDTLNVVDIGAPDDPVVLMSGLAWSPDANIADLFVDGDYLWAASFHHQIGLFALDVSDPTPSLGWWDDVIGSAGVQSSSWDVRIDGDLAYTMGWQAFETYDISEPLETTALDYYLMSTQGSQALSVAGDHAYASDGTSASAVHVLDISDPSDIGWVSTYDSYVGGGPNGLLADGDVLFVLNDQRVVVDISDPSNPVRVSPAVYGLGCCLMAAPTGDYLCCISGEPLTSSTRLEMLQVYQRRVDRGRDVIQSLDIAPARQEVKWARLSTAQTGSITWFLSADGGAHWLEVAPDNRWVDFAPYVGTELVWKAVLAYEEGIEPRCESLTVEWETDDVGVDEGDLPQRFALYQNAPNPVGPATTLHYDVPATGGAVTIIVYDAAGRTVRTIVDGHEPPGRKEARWDGTDERGNAVASGVYYCRMRAGEFKATRKIILVR